MRLPPLARAGRHLAAITSPLLASSLLLLPQPAAADGDSAQKMQLVLDASGSMGEAAKGGTKIAAARSALTHVVDTLPSDAVVGMRVYGATIDSGKGACTDSQQVVEPGTDNRDALRKAVGDYKPLGETPIGYALRQAGKDLGSSGKRTIVLVSDGESTCDPDPCKVARDLSKDGIDLKIDVVGLSVDAKTRKQLKCIAGAGHGTYYDADDSASLTERLKVTSTRAFRPFDLTGTPVTGTNDTTTAPEIGVGQWLDRIPAKGSSAFYKIPRTVAGSTLHVGTTTRTSSGSLGSGIVLEMRAPDGSLSCGRGSGFETAIGGTGLVNGSVSSWTGGRSPECDEAEALYLNVKISVDADLAGSPFEIVVYEEPPLREGAAADLPPAQTEVAWEPMTPGDPTTTIVPGTSIASAPVVGPGTYRLDIRSGERQVVAVPLSWGQHLQAQIDATLSEGAYDGAGIYSGFDVSVIGPTRSDAAVNLTYNEEPDDWTRSPFANMWTQDDKHWRRGAVTLPVTFLNRDSVVSGVPSAALPGYRYVDVGFSNTANDSAALSYTLTLEVFGEAQDGPAYAEGGDAVVPDAEEVGAPPTDPPARDSSGAGERVDAASRETEGLPWLPIGLGAGGLLLVAAGTAAILLARRPRRPAAPQPQQPWNGQGGW